MSRSSLDPLKNLARFLTTPPKKEKPFFRQFIKKPSLKKINCNIYNIYSVCVCALMAASCSHYCAIFALLNTMTLSLLRSFGFFIHDV